LSDADLARLRLLVTGRVQGIFYRATAANEAKRLQINGFARNLRDGSVELVLEGNRTALELFLEWAKHGPPRARVAHVSVEWTECIGDFRDFRIR
jgi:acylphosphatase